MTEPAVEDLSISHFAAGGIPSFSGSALDLDASAERSTEAGHLLAKRTSQPVRKLNPHLPGPSIDAVVASLSRPPHPTLIENNPWFHALLTDGVPAEYKDAATGETRGGRARLIDFDNPAHNDFLVVRQLTSRKPIHCRGLAGSVRCTSQRPAVGDADTADSPPEHNRDDRVAGFVDRDSGVVLPDGCVRVAGRKPAAGESCHGFL